VLNDFIAARFIKGFARQRGGKLRASEACLRRSGLASIDDDAAYAAARVSRIGVHGANAGRFCAAIEQRRFAASGMVAAEQRRALAPAAAATNLAVFLHNYIGAISDQLGIQPHDVEGGFDPLGRQVGREQGAN